MYASNSRRIAAYIIDIWIVMLISFCLSIFFIDKENASNNNYLAEQELLIEKISKNEISIDEAYYELSQITYEFDKSNFILNLIDAIIVILYFGLFQFYKNTIGKKIMKIKVVGENLTLNKMIIRSMLLYGSFVVFINSLCISILNPINYSLTSSILNISQMVFIMTTLAMIIFRNDKKGMHDLIVKTTVMEEK